MLSLAERYTWEGRLEGREEGREEGSVNKAVSIAKNLLSMSLSVDQIVKATGLSHDKVKTYRNK